MPAHDLLRGVIQFGNAVVPDSARLIAGVGNERNTLLVLTVEADLGRGKMTRAAPDSSCSTKTLDQG